MEILVRLLDDLDDFVATLMAAIGLLSADS